jgi:hypothetical protein
LGPIDFIGLRQGFQNVTLVSCPPWCWMAFEHHETTSVRAFFYPLLFLVPGFDGPVVECQSFRLARRRWETSTFDLATLATKHKLHLPYQVMDVFLSRCNMELCISGKRSLEEANEAFQMLRISLYSNGVSPFLCPFVTTYSINEYSGINSRDSDLSASQDVPGHGNRRNQRRWDCGGMASRTLVSVLAYA